jgi:phi LC3 family holin
MINLKVRFKNPVFIAQFLLSIFVPILGYFGLTAHDLTTWNVVLDLLVKAVSNPFVLGTIVISAWNALNDPTTKGLIKDSKTAMKYNAPK